ncbi:Trk-type K+ transport system membrane component [Clostridium beijerinckii]|nr:Trk-type K+ transport system membrane component [Clostridium beijerinckii]
MTEALMKKPKLSAVQILAIGFVLVISIGAILLSLPISSANNEYTNFLDSLFTSTSAVCVTGLVTLDTGTYWSIFGNSNNAFN